MNRNAIISYDPGREAPQTIRGMRIPVRYSYVHRGKEFSFLKDLYSERDQRTILGTLTWAADRGVVITFEPIMEEAA